MPKQKLSLHQLDERESVRDAQIESRLTAVETTIATSLPNIHEDIREVKSAIDRQSSRLETFATAIQNATIAALQDKNKSQSQMSLGALAALVTVLATVISVSASFIIALVKK